MNDLRAWADEHLAFPRFLSIVYGVERIVEDTCFDHFDGREILNSTNGGEVSVWGARRPY